VRISEMTFLRDYWYPVLPSQQLTDRPQPIRLFGEDWALWRDSQGLPSAGRNRCPHRAGSLSAGWVEGDCIVCPYHGWQYDRTGQCRLIPHLESHLPIPPKARIDPAHTGEAYGMVWMCVGSPQSELPRWREAEEPKFRLRVEFFEHRPVNALRIIDNAIDLSHVTFVHRGTFADPDKLVIPPVPNIEQSPTGFIGHFIYDIPGVGPQLGLDAAPNARFERMTEIELLAPATVRTRFFFADFPDGSRDYSFLGSAVPVDDENAIYVRVTALGGSEEDRPYEKFHEFSVRVQEEDATVLAGTTKDFSIDPTDEVHLRIDRLTLEYRRYLRVLALAYAERESRPLSTVAGP
jgi:phenylpropionate dioxygenase-like ring-hydroxylating dioxygenase large terminal subunit